MNATTNPRRLATRLLPVLIAALGTLGLVAAQAGKDAGAKAAKGAPVNRFIGADKCKNCHQSDGSGNAWRVWHERGHSKAFETLASPAAKKIAAELGIADPQTSDKCMKCHQTAFGAPAEALKKGFDAKMGVQCETCHGPGEQHLKARFAAAAKGGGEEGFGDEKTAELVALPAGEIVGHVDQKTCLVCHNEESPTFKPFCFHERAATIAHLDPRKPREKGEELVCGCAPCACKNGCEEGKCAVKAKDKK
jgi:hypothetical protein